MIAAELVVKKAAALFEAERDCGAEANMGKMLAADAAWKAAEACLQTFGGFGYAREYGIERKWRETRLYQTAPISPTWCSLTSPSTCWAAAVVLRERCALHCHPALVAGIQPSRAPERFDRWIPGTRPG